MLWVKTRLTPWATCCRRFAPLKNGLDTMLGDFSAVPASQRTGHAMRTMIAVLMILLSVNSRAQEKDYPPTFAGAREEVYKRVGDVELKLWIFEPRDQKSPDVRPAIVFFFGGGWKSGKPSQFEQQCRYLASRGIVAMTADYRVRNRHGTLADRCVADAKSAIRWVRKNAERLGIDPNRIAAGGGSAGGHLAACTGIVPGLDEPHEDAAISSVPNAMVLFNPAVTIARFGDREFDQAKLDDWASRAGVPPKDISPIHHLRKGLPPAIIFHGTADTAVPFWTVEEFTLRSAKLGNTCQLCAYDGSPHGFFNYGRGGTPGEAFLRTVAQMDQFLIDQGFLRGEPAIGLPDSKNAHLRTHFDNSRIKFQQEMRGNVAFIGGSITQMNGYRPMVMEYLQQKFPETEFKFTNAGISSTCSTTGAFRLQEHVLKHQPDLLFVEFAVNDDQDAAHAPRECLRGMEGIIRQARLHNPKIDIVVTHFINPPMLEKLQNGQKTVSRDQHERVAAHYGVATSDLAREVADRITAGSLTWKEFGGTHPKTPGNRIAADLIADLLRAAWKQPLANNAQAVNHRLPKPIDPRSYFRGRMLELSEASAGEGWALAVPKWSTIRGNLREQFAGTPLLCSSEPGSELTLDFQGSAVGAYVLAGPDAGTVEYTIDGSPPKSVDLYHRHSKGLHYPRTVMFATELDAAKHRLVLRVGKQQNASSKGHAVRILRLVTNDRAKE